MQEKKQIKLVLSGTGTLLYYHVGVYLKLAELFDVTALTGTSGGAIIASLIAIYKDPNKVLEIIKSFQLKDMRDLNITWNPLGLIKGNKLLEMMKKYLNKQFKDVPNVNVIATKVKDLSEVVFNAINTPDIWVYDAVRASMSIAGIFQPHSINGEFYIDGGYVENVAYDIYGKDENVFAVSMGITHEFKINNIIDALLIGQYASIKANERKDKEDNPLCNSIVINSDKNSLSFDFTPSEISVMIESGYTSVSDYLRLKGIK